MPCLEKLKSSTVRHNSVLEKQGGIERSSNAYFWSRRHSTMHFSHVKWWHFANVKVMKYKILMQISFLASSDYFFFLCLTVFAKNIELAEASAFCKTMCWHLSYEELLNKGPVDRNHFCWLAEISLTFRMQNELLMSRKIASVTVRRSARVRSAWIPPTTLWRQIVLAHSVYNKFIIIPK